MEKTNNNMYRFISLVKRAIAYSSIDKDYPLLKEETGKIGISLYSLHTLANKFSQETASIAIADKTAFVRVNFDGEVVTMMHEPVNIKEEKAPINEAIVEYKPLISYRLDIWWKYVWNKI